MPVTAVDDGCGAPGDSQGPPVVAGIGGAHLLLLAVAFGITRLAAFALGLRLDPNPLWSFHQFLDVNLLREDLLASLWNLHSQPPAFNVLLGVLLKWLGEAGTVGVVVVLNGLSGFGSVVAIECLCLRLRLPRGWALGAAVAFCLYPAAWLFESLLFYSQWELLLNLLLPLCLLHALDKPAAAWRFFALLAVFVLLRAHMHLLVYTGVSLLLAWRQRWDRRVTIPGILCLAPCLLWYGKNALLFGFFGASSWMGMNVARVALEPLEVDQRAAISPLATIPAFLPLDAYKGAVVQSTWVGQHPAVSKPAKAGGAPNFNHGAYIDISRAYMRDSMRAITQDPARLARQIAMGIKRFFRPAEEVSFLLDDASPLSTPLSVFNVVVLGRFPASLGLPLPSTGIFLFVGWVFSLVMLMKLAAHHNGSAVHMTVLFIGFLLLYQAMVLNLFEFGENNRFRYPLDGLYLVLFTYSMHKAWNWLPHKRGIPLAPFRRDAN